MQQIVCCSNLSSDFSPLSVAVYPQRQNTELIGSVTQVGAAIISWVIYKSIDRQLITNCFDHLLIDSVFFQAKMPKSRCFHLLKCESFLLFLIIYESKYEYLWVLEDILLHLLELPESWTVFHFSLFFFNW